MHSPLHNHHVESHYLTSNNQLQSESIKPFNYRNFSVSQTSSKESKGGVINISPATAAHILNGMGAGADYVLLNPQTYIPYDLIQFTDKL